jgi:hypothetical protein
LVAIHLFPCHFDKRLRLFLSKHKG